MSPARAPVPARRTERPGSGGRRSAPRVNEARNADSRYRTQPLIHDEPRARFRHVFEHGHVHEANGCFVIHARLRLGSEEPKRDATRLGLASFVQEERSSRCVHNRGAAWKARRSRTSASFRGEPPNNGSGVRFGSVVGAHVGGPMRTPEATRRRACRDAARGRGSTTSGDAAARSREPRGRSRSAWRRSASPRFGGDGARRPRQCPGRPRAA